MVTIQNVAAICSTIGDYGYCGSAITRARFTVSSLRIWTQYILIILSVVLTDRQKLVDAIQMTLIERNIIGIIVL